METATLSPPEAAVSEATPQSMINTGSDHSNKVDAESLNNITTDTSLMNASMESALSDENDNVPMVVTSSNEIDPDIDVAAEQIVNDFTEHLNQRVFPNMVEALTDDDIENDDPVIGVMSSSLAAGGFEELIVGLDQPNDTKNNINSTSIGMDDSNAYIVEDVDDNEEEVEEEEIIDSSYEEEEITEVEEYMDDVDIEEIMEESGIIIAEDKKQLQTEDVAEESPNDNDIKELSRDESIHGIVQDESPDDTATATATASIAATDNMSAHMSSNTIGRSTHTMGSANTMDTDFATGTTMTNNTDSSYGNDSLAVSESTRNTSISEILREHQQPQQQNQPLYGDVLLGDMSEMTMGTRTDTDSYFIPNESSATTLSTNKSSTPNFANGVTNTSNLLSQVQDDDDDTFDGSEPVASKKNEDTYPMASAATLTAAVAAAAAEAAIHGDPAMKSTRDKSISSANTTVSENSATPTDYYSSQSKNNSTMPVPPALNHQMSVPPALQKTPIPEEQETLSALPTNHDNNEIPVPPALSGAPSQSFGKDNDGDDDIETGKKRNYSNRRNSSKKGPEMAQPSSIKYHNNDEDGKDEANKDKDDDNDNDQEDISEGMNLSIYASIVLCLAVIFMVVMLSVFLTRKGNDGNDRDIVIPTAAPVVVVPPVVPVAVPSVPPVVISEPPTILGTWTKSIEPVFGAAGSNFGTAIVTNENNMWSVGAPNMLNGNSVETGGVVSSTFIDDNWVLLPFLYGDNFGDMFGAAIDMSKNSMIVGAPMSLIVNTSTPAGTAYYFSYNPTSAAWDKSSFVFRSADDLLATNGEFGHAVALGFTDETTSIPRVVIGAPKYNVALDTFENGRVYTYTANSADVDSEWSSMEASPLVGKNAYDWFGYSVDMSFDGMRFIVGAPGSNASGYVQIYEWDGAQWNLDFEDEGNPGEGFGSYVTIISENLFAIGGPGYENGSGRVVVYQRSSEQERAASDYVLKGEPIVGSVGDELGAYGSITGGKHGDSEEIVLIVAAATGAIATYSFDESAGRWKPHVELLTTDVSSKVYVEFSSSAGLITGYPENDEISLYSTETVPIVNATTETPVNSPVVDATMFPTLSPVGASTTMNPTPRTGVTTESPIVATVTQAPVGSSPTTESPIGISPTTEAPVNGQSWEFVAGNFTPQVEVGSEYGSSISMTSSTLVVGASKTLGNGAVFVYIKDTTSLTWSTEATQQLFGIDSGSEYGSAIDVSTDNVRLVIGAPRTIASDTFTEFGAVYCYELVSGQYQLMNDVIRGDTDIYSASEMFGSSIAVSTSTIAIGAPFSNLENVLLRGRVYLYSLDSATSSWQRTTTFQGQNANSTFGSSMDMSSDGTQLIVGAPGTNYAEVYVYDGSQWTLEYVINSLATDSATTGFGTVVLAISNNLFAVSDPNFSDSTGRVVIYTKDDTNTYMQSGGDIVGTVPGAQFGTFLTGIIDPTTSVPSILIGSTDGLIIRYDFDGSTWVQHPSTLSSASLGVDITSISSTSSSGEVVITDTQNVEIYRWSS